MRKRVQQQQSSTSSDGALRFGFTMSSLYLKDLKATNNSNSVEAFDDEIDENKHSNNVISSHYPLELEEQTLYPIEYTEYPSDSWLSRGVHNWLFPPQVPRECQLLRPENICVPACYLMVGLLQGLSGPLINVYPLDLGATEAQQTTVSSIRSLPASFKLVFGFLSDNLPIQGYRRKSYMLIGWTVASMSLLALMSLSDLTMSKDGPPTDAPSIPFLSLSLLGFGTGFWLADVMGDSIVAEKAKLERVKGHIQSTCYACRFFGLMMAAPLSTVLYSTVGPVYVIALLAMLPLTSLPLIFMLKEDRNVPVKSTSDQCSEIYKTVCSRAVWQPMGFVYLYNILQVGNGAWREFLKTVLKFTSNQLNSILIVAYVLLYFGILAYKYYFITWSWRSVYIFTTLINGFFSALQVLLIHGITFGLSNFVFALGDDAFSEFIGGIQFLPTTIMMVHLCPSGSEGASYAMFTTVSNSASTLSTAISTHLLGIWDVSKDALANGEVLGMTNLTLLTTALQVSGILFVGLLPRTKEDLGKLHHESSSSKIGGVIFLTITFLSIFYAVIVGVLNIVMPGWSGES